MQYCLTSNTKDCRNCYKCIRHCPIKAISFTDDKASIIKEDCILCGQCYTVCPQELKVIRNDIEKVKRLLRENDRVYVSVAPSFIARYPDSDIDCMKRTLKKLGFTDVEETAVGATIVKKAYDEMLEEDRDVIISSCCHSVNMLIKRHYPNCLPYLADVLSPMLAHGRDIKMRFGEDTKVVFLGPCIAKKDESDKNSSLVEAALTFEEFDAWLAKENITLETTDEKDGREQSKARLFPTNGGVLRTMERRNDDWQYLICDGVENCVQTLKDIEDGKLHKCFIEMSSCQGSCVNGPIMKKQAQSILYGTAAVNRYAGQKDFEGLKAGYDDIKCVYKKDYVKDKTPTEEQIQEMLVKMGKEDPSARLNCGCCGYDSCHAKAIAILQGNANIDMCLPYLMEKAASLSDQIIEHTPNGLMVLDENFNITLANQAMCRIVRVSRPEELVGRPVMEILDPMDYLEALQGERINRKREYLQDYDRYVENTVVYDTKLQALVCVMLDITRQEKQAQKDRERIEKTMKITDALIDKNMQTVHEIASLLGETAAETKVALLSLKDTIYHEN
ncbi:MAG: PAS domain-containing protein [Solobacterium sp.]|nr:PAS domain-containing protein [Solobacterium sp.]